MNKIRPLIQHILKHYKYRILLASLFVFLLLMWPGIQSHVSLFEGREIFKIALGVVVTVTMVVSYSVRTKSLTLHGLICIAVLLFTSPAANNNQIVDYLMGIIVISFFARITLAIIKTLLHEKHISSDLLVGCVAGYILIAISGFLFFSSLDNYLGNIGFVINKTAAPNHIFSIMYYSFVTLMTIGYGDIVPAMPSMQLATIIYSLIGWSYSTFVLAMVLKKFDSDYL